MRKVDASCRNWSIIIYHLVASLIYCGSAFSLVPEYRLYALERSGAIDYFPNPYGFLIYGIFTLALSVMWFVYGYFNMKKTKEGERERMIFDYPKVRHAFVVPSCLILYTFCQQALPYVYDISVFPGFFVSLLASVGLSYSVFVSTPKRLKEFDMKLSKKFMVQAFPAWVLVWELALLLFWIVKMVDIYAPEDYSTKMNAQSTSPVPTEYHQKTVTQLTGWFSCVIISMVTTVIEATTRSYLSVIPCIIFLSAIAVDNNEAYWFAFGGLMLVVVAEILVVFLDLFLCQRVLKREHMRIDKEKLFE